MSIKEFWEDDPELFWAYRFSYIQTKKQEQELNNNNIDIERNDGSIFRVDIETTTDPLVISHKKQVSSLSIPEY